MHNTHAWPVPLAGAHVHAHLLHMQHRVLLIEQVAPDFSCRLIDETYSKENSTIDRIQDVMVDYFKGRTGPLAKAGIGALKQSMAGIYYLPFQAATSLFFRFSGQSIPNRWVVLLPSSKRAPEGSFTPAWGDASGSVMMH